MTLEELNKVWKGRRIDPSRVALEGDIWSGGVDDRVEFILNDADYVEQFRFFVDFEGGRISRISACEYSSGDPEHTEPFGPDGYDHIDCCLRDGLVE